MKERILRRGFTLIEILVVISIISIIATIMYASFNDARNDSRNKALQVSLKEVQLSMEIYKAQNGRYPANVDDLNPDFISDLPKTADSGNSSCSFAYTTDANGTWYKYTAIRCITGISSASEGVQADDEFARCLSSCPSCSAAYRATPAFYESYAIYSAGGECQ